MNHNVTIEYTNWRRERGTRVIRSRRIAFENSRWHPETRWLLEAIDVEKDEIREFAMKDIHSWTVVG